ncbi:hypothetical protein PG996_004230 [Apiospora saccharicola]|uniref:Uncharacterized protein n=1 Tax=Apiospora saccharicola TaxID=335842 RepID=A0ABR1W3J5_9PEZI
MNNDIMSKRRRDTDLLRLINSAPVDLNKPVKGQAERSDAAYYQEKLVFCDDEFFVRDTEVRATFEI